MASSRRSEIEDLEDRVSVFQDVVKDLNSGEVIALRELLSQYIILEDTILLGLLTISKLVTTQEEKDALSQVLTTFNMTGSEFQDSWSPEFWDVYGQIKEPSQKQLKKTMNSQLRDVIDLALSLGRSEKTVGGTLKYLDCASEQYLDSHKKREVFCIEEPRGRGASKCIVF